MSVTIILQSPNTATITQTGAVSATIQHTGAVSATIQQIVGQGVSVQNIVPNAVTINSSMAASTWGSITGTITDQTDLTTYIADEIADIPTPTLDSVTTQGSTTTNAISVGGLTASSLVYPSTDGTTGQIIQTDGAGTLSFVDAPSTGVTELNGLTGDLDLVAGSNVTITPSGSTITIASTGGGTQDLQSVTDEGATTTNTIQVGGLTVTGVFKNYDEATPDIGAKQDNDLRGYGDAYVSNKTLAYCRIGASAFNEEGAVRIKDNVFQTYIDGAWQDVVTNFRFREDSNGQYELEHKPIGFTEWIEVLSGNSDLLGLNGLPITQNYATSMGAFPVPLEIDGGTF